MGGEPYLCRDMVKGGLKHVSVVGKEAILSQVS